LVDRKRRNVLDGRLHLGQSASLGELSIFRPMTSQGCLVDRQGCIV
jgi:hypothetical protein